MSQSLRRTIGILLVIVVIFIGAGFYKTTEDHRKARLVTEARYDRLRSGLVKIQVLINRAAHGEESMNKEISAASKDGDRRHDNSISNSPSEDVERQNAIAEQQDVEKAKSSVTEFEDSFISVADAYAGLFGESVVKQARADLGQMVEHRHLALSSWTTAISEIVDEYKASANGSTITKIDPSALLHYYSEATSEITKSNTYSDALLVDLDALFARINGEIKAAKNNLDSNH